MISQCAALKDAKISVFTLFGKPTDRTPKTIPPLSQLPQIQLNSIRKPKVKRICYQGVPNGNFEQAFDIFLVKPKVVEIEIVPGINA